MRLVEEGVRAQQRHGVGEQEHDPSEVQAVEEEGGETKLVFLVRLRRFNPRPHFVAQVPAQRGSQGHLPEQNLVALGGISEFTWAVPLLPASRAKGGVGAHAKPLLLGGSIQAQPLQPLALRTTRDAIGRIRLDPAHVWTQAGNQGAPELLAQAALHGQIDVSHVTHRPGWDPVKHLLATLE